MQEFVISLLGSSASGNFVRKPININDKVYSEVYEWSKIKNQSCGENSNSEAPRMNQPKCLKRSGTSIVEDTLRLCDCGGHNHYVLLNSLSFTRDTYKEQFS